MKISIKWVNGKEYGDATVIEPCCDGIEKDQQFYVTTGENQLYAHLSKGYDDAISTPFNFCPSCGIPVHVVGEVELPPVQRQQVVVGSGIFVSQGFMIRHAPDLTDVDQDKGVIP